MELKNIDSAKPKAFPLHYMSTMIRWIYMLIIPAAIFYITNSNACATEFRFQKYQKEDESFNTHILEMNHPLERANNDNGQGKKWNPTVKYAAVILTAGVGTFLIFNAFSPVLGRGECGEDKLSESPCLESQVLGGVIGGLSLLVIATGIAVHF